MSSEEKKRPLDNQEPEIKKEDQAELESSNDINQEEEERNGIIPEGMDFKKFLGCGG